MSTGHILVFAIVIIALLLADFLLVGRSSHKISTREAGIWTGIFIMVSLAFNGFIYITEGREQATAFLTAYTIEKVLSVDNLFVFVMVFQFFKVPSEYHHKVLFWGVLGAIVMRAIFIFVGIGLVKVLEFNIAGYDINILIFLFGIFLVYAGLKAGREAFSKAEEEDEDYSKSAGAKLIRWIFGSRITHNYVGDKFFTKMELVAYPSTNTRTSKIVRYATPLLVVVGVVEFTDLLFAVDSIPAIFAVSKDPFILYTSNIFAILGLRSMYFLLANILPKFIYLKHGLAIILAFIGIKMIIAPVAHIPSGVSLLLVVATLIMSVVLSLTKKAVVA